MKQKVNSTALSVQTDPLLPPSPLVTWAERRGVAKEQTTVTPHVHADLRTDGELSRSVQQLASFRM